MVEWSELEMALVSWSFSPDSSWYWAGLPFVSFDGGEG